MKEKRKAILYQRFSSASQVGNSSLDRQTDAQKAWLKNNKDVVVIDSYVDKQMSGWSGKHIKDGSLGKLLAAIEAKIIPEGTLILVEHFSRLTRQNIDKAEDMLKFIWKHGITIVTVRDNQQYPPDTVNKMSKRIGLMVLIEQAYADSKWRSEKIKASYVKREKDAEKGIVPSLRRPFFLDKDGSKNEFAPVIEDIFNLYESGLGQRLILRQIKKDYPECDAVKQMIETTIIKWIRNDIVRGVWRTYEVYDRVISDKQFYDVEKIHTERLFINVQPNRKWPLSGLVQCGHCGKGMSIQQSQKSNPAFRCSNKQRYGSEVSGCDGVSTFPYLVVHYYFFKHIMDRIHRKISDFDTNHASTDELNKISSQLLKLNRQANEQMEQYNEVSAAGGRIKKLLEIMEITDEKIEQLEDRQSVIKKELKTLSSMPISDSAIELIEDTKQFNLTMHKLGVKLILKNKTISYEDHKGHTLLNYDRKTKLYNVFDNQRQHEWQIPTKSVTPDFLLMKDIDWRFVFEKRKALDKLLEYRKIEKDKIKYDQRAKEFKAEFGGFYDPMKKLTS